MASIGFAIASVAAIILYQSRELVVARDKIEFENAPKKQKTPLAPEMVDADLKQARELIAELERQNSDLQKRANFEKQKPPLPVEAQMMFQFSDTPILKHKLTKSEAEQLLTALNDLTSFIVNNRPSLFYSFMPEQRMHLGSIAKIPSFAEKRERAAEAARAYTKIKIRINDVVNGPANFAEDLKLIVGGTDALFALEKAIGALNNIESRLGVVLQRPSPDEDSLAKFFIQEQAAAAVVTMLKAEDWFERFLKSRAPSAREEIRAYL